MTFSLSPHPDLNWRLMQSDEAVLAYDLHQQVLQLTPPGLVRQDALEYFEKHVESQGRIMGCFAGCQLVAYGILGLQSPMLSFMANLLNVEASTQARMCLLDGASCDPAWRGRRLHEDAIALRIELAKAAGKSFIAVTVAPTNLASLHGLLRRGFVVRQYAEVYGDLPRLLLCLDLHANAIAEQTRQIVASADLQGHRDALQLGLLGYSCQQDEHGIWGIAYGRPQIS